MDEQAAKPKEITPNKEEVFEKLKNEFEGLTTSEEKLQKSIDIMEESLAQKGTPDFKKFWDSRACCLELLREDIAPAVKAIQWKKYRDLTKEARRLKEFFEEKTAFAVEQIEIAIDALEKDITDLSQVVTSETPEKLNRRCDALASNVKQYSMWQNELDILNTYAARVNALRKELIKTDMRIRQKNKFFERLSIAGNNVFPKRKELIKNVSELFVVDVQKFVNTSFANPSEDNLFSLRQEIKSLQTMAKSLTINTHSFNQTRQLLAECWEKLKGLEKEKKKGIAEKQQLYSENASLVEEKIGELATYISGEELTLSEGQKRVQEVTQYMRSVELGRDEVKTLRQKLSDAQKPLYAKIEEEDKKRRELEEKKQIEHQEKLVALQKQIDALSSTDSSDSLLASLNEVRAQIKTLDLSSHEINEFNQKLLPIEDTLALYEESELIKNSQYAEAMKKKKQRRERIRTNIAKYRKQSGGSGLDFEQSLHINECLNAEKERLEQINKEIDDVSKQVTKGQS